MRVQRHHHLCLCAAAGLPGGEGSIEITTSGVSAGLCLRLEKRRRYGFTNEGAVNDIGGRYSLQVTDQQGLQASALFPGAGGVALHQPLGSGRRRQLQLLPVMAAFPFLSLAGGQCQPVMEYRRYYQLCHQSLPGHLHPGGIERYRLFVSGILHGGDSRRAWMGRLLYLRMLGVTADVGLARSPPAAHFLPSAGTPDR